MYLHMHNFFVVPLTPAVLYPLTNRKQWPADVVSVDEEDSTIHAQVEISTISIIPALVCSYASAYIACM